MSEKMRLNDDMTITKTPIAVIDDSRQVWDNAKIASGIVEGLGVISIGIGAYYILFTGSRDGAVNIGFGAALLPSGVVLYLDSKYNNALNVAKKFLRLAKEGDAPDKITEDFKINKDMAVTTTTRATYTVDESRHMSMKTKMYTASIETLAVISLGYGIYSVLNGNKTPLLSTLIMTASAAVIPLGIIAYLDEKFNNMLDTAKKFLRIKEANQ